MTADALLEVEDLTVRYGDAIALRSVSLTVHEGEVVTVIGGNGAGKSTLLKTISAIPDPTQRHDGRVAFAGRRIDRLAAHRIARLGLVQVPEGRRVFPRSTVQENLQLGAHRRGRGSRSEEIAAVYERFPVLGRRRDQPAGLLSGGEQQMLALGRALLADPRLLVLDEPSLGLAPLIAAEMFEVVAELARAGTTILLVEQLARAALAVADRAYVLETGSITLSGPAAEVAARPEVRAAYLGERRRSG